MSDFNSLPVAPEFVEILADNCLKTALDYLQANNIPARIGLKNISLIKNRYRVRIKMNHRVVFEKEFKTLDAAITSRDDALKKYHGEFANLD